MNHDPSHQDPEPVSFWRTRCAFGLIVMGAVAAAEMRVRFGDAFDVYAARTPRFLPSLRKAALAST